MKDAPLPREGSIPPLGKQIALSGRRTIRLLIVDFRLQMGPPLAEDLQSEISPPV
jgi:hypothetical protein